MEGNIRTWKLKARKALKGNYAPLIFGMLILNLLSSLGQMLGVYLFSGSSVFELIASNAVTFIFSLIVCVFSAGLSYMYMKISRGMEGSYRDMLYFFYNHPDRIIVTSFVLSMISLILNLPTYFIGDMGTTAEEVMAYLMKFMVMYMISSVLNIIVTLPFMQSYYLMADDLELGGIAALKKSMKLMKGRKLKYLLLQMSFIPWWILILVLVEAGIMITLLSLLMIVGAAMTMWLTVYMEMANVFFYRDLIGDYENHVHWHKDEEETDGYYSNGNPWGNDYNNGNRNPWNHDYNNGNRNPWSNDYNNENRDLWDNQYGNENRNPQDDNQEQNSGDNDEI